MKPHQLLHRQLFIVLSAVFIFEAFLFTTLGQDISYWFQYWWMFPTAFIIALVVNTVGISGAALFVPFFILLFPLISGTPLLPNETVQLGLVTESFGLSSSALAFLSFGLVDLTIARRAILTALPFVVIGAFFTTAVPQAVFYTIISILLITAVFLIRFKERFTKKRLHEQNKSHVDYRSSAVSSSHHVTKKSADGTLYSYCITEEGKRKRSLGYGTGGFFQGAAGFGIGELGIITMMLSHIPTRIAIGTSHAIVALTAITASLLHFFFASHLPAEYVFPWNIPAMSVPAVILGGQLAPYIASKLPTKALESFVSSLFIVIALSLLVLALGN